MKIHQLGTDGEMRVVISNQANVLVHALPDESGTTGVVAVSSEKFNGHCFLVSTKWNANVFGCGHAKYRASILPMRLHMQVDTGTAALLYPINRKYLCARPRAEGETFATIWADHPDPGPGRLFRLLQVDQSAADENVFELVQCIELLLAERKNPERLLTMLNNLPPKYAGLALTAVVPILTLQESKSLAVALLREPTLLLMLSRTLPPDVWASHSLPALAHWIEQRFVADAASGQTTALDLQSATTRGFVGRNVSRAFSALRRQVTAWQHVAKRDASEVLSSTDSKSSPRPSRQIAIGSDYDALALPGWRNEFISSAHTLNAAVRSVVEPCGTVCIVAPARNEGMYLLEWIAYHRAIGIEAFYLYTNDNQDGSDMLLAALAQAGVITWIDNRVGSSVSVQAKGYGHALSLLPDLLNYRWAAFVDLDEYVSIDNGLFNTISDYLSWQELQEVDAIALNWQMIRPSCKGALSGLLTERCLQPAATLDRHVKCIFKPRKFVHTTNHFPLAIDRRHIAMRSGSGALYEHSKDNELPDFDALALSARPDGGMACINHYFYKSAEEFMWKFSRNRGSQAVSHGIHLGLTRWFLDAFMYNSRPEQSGVRTPLVDRQAALRRELTVLLSLPGVEQATAIIRNRYEDRLRQVKDAYRNAPVILEAGRLGEEFLALADGA